MTDLGRLPATEVAGKVLLDDPSKKVAAILTKQDEIIAKLNAILQAIEDATDAASLFTGLDTAEIKAQLSTITFKL